MNERNQGRFGVKTNQTLKYNSAINTKEMGCIFQWVDMHSSDGRQHVVSHSLDKHRRWELVPTNYSSDDQESTTSTLEKQERKEKNKDDKKEEFQRRTDKSKHAKRLERKEQNKQVAQSEKQKELEKQQAEQESKQKYKDEKEPNVLIYSSGKEIRNNLSTEKSSDINIYSPEDRGTRMKKGQSRHREKYVYSGDIESRKEKKENFVKSIFL